MAPDTLTGRVVGNYHLLRRLGRGDAIDYRTDLCSLGIVLYELLAGQPPYQASTPWGVIQQQIAEPLPPLRQRNLQIAPALATATAQALAKGPTDRYQSIGGLKPHPFRATMPF